MLPLLSVPSLSSNPFKKLRDPFALMNQVLLEILMHATAYELFFKLG